VSTTTRPSVAGRGTAPRNGTPVDLRLDPPQGQARRPKLSWIALGLAVVLAGGLFGAITLARVADREPVLALTTPIERGQLLTAEHLRTVNVASDEQLSLVALEDRDELIGLVSTSSLPTGSLLAREQFSDGPQLEPGSSVVGLELQAGEYPTRSLAPGDRVEVVRTPDPASARSDAATGASVLTGDAEVFAVEALSETSSALMISLSVPREVGPAIAGAAADGRVRLVLVSAS
jgi:hypothetical protein